MVDSVIVLLFVSALVLNICTKNAPNLLDNCLLSTEEHFNCRVSERKDGGEGTTTCNLDFKASCDPDWRENIHPSLFHPLDAVNFILFFCAQ